MPTNSLDSILRHFEGKQHELLPALQQIRQGFGALTPDTLVAVASYFNLSRAEVHGVASFYTDLASHTPARHRLQICGAEACQAVGCRSLVELAQQILGIALNETTADGSVHFSLTYCLGNCACGPSLRVDDDVHGLVDAAKFDALVQQLRTLPTKLPPEGQ